MDWTNIKEALPNLNETILIAAPSFSQRGIPATVTHINQMPDKLEMRCTIFYGGSISVDTPVHCEYWMPMPAIPHPEKHPINNGMRQGGIFG